MKKVRRSFAAAMLLLAMTCVALADDGQMGIPLTSPPPPPASSSQGPTDADPATSSTTDDSAGQADASLLDAGLMLFESLSSIL